MMSDLGTFVESYKLTDVTKLWARERLVHEVIVGRELANGIVTEGLRFQSVNPKWVKAGESFRGYPYVGYASRQEDKPIIIRAVALEHLLAIVGSGEDPEMDILCEEYVTKDDFRNWLVHTGRALPAFWFGESERY